MSISKEEGDAVERLSSFFALVCSLVGEEKTYSSALAAPDDALAVPASSGVLP